MHPIKTFLSLVLILGSFTVFAENGTVKIGGQYMDTLSFCHIKDYITPAALSNSTGNKFTNHEQVLQNVVEVLNANAGYTNAVDGLKVIDLIERIYAAKNI